MKKIYNSPKALVVEIKAQSLLAGSLFAIDEAAEMTSGSFGAREADFSDEIIDLDEFTEE